MTSKRRTPPRPSAQEPYAYEEAGQPSDLEPSAEPKPMARQAVQDIDRIGDILRRVREHRGEDLESISDYLRIRPAYLFALENNRYEDLPADAYVIGFLRSYAAYLGLDGRGAIDQYRREMAGRRRKPQLSMPQPMPEGRAPTIAVLAGAALAALLIYGVWYGLSSPDRDVLEKPVALTTEQGSSTATDAAPQNALQQMQTPSPTTLLPGQTATSDGITLPVPEASVATKALPATAAPEATTPATTNKTPVASKEEKEVKATDKESKETKESKEAKDKTPAPAATEPAPASTPPASPAKTEAPSPSSKTAAQPSSFGEKGKTRVTIKAEKESWVLVTDSKGNTVFDQTLKPGETYNVPAGKGLKLTTGNAGGISFAMDGKGLPKLGQSDSVVRAIPLEPEKLKGLLTDTESTSTEAPTE